MEPPELTPVEQSAPQGRREDARARLNLPARLVTFNGTSQCVLLDLSCGGAKLAAGDIPKVGAMVVVEDCPVELFGTVSWSQGDVFGIHFDTRLPLEKVVEVRRFADGYEMRETEQHRNFVRKWVTGGS